MLLLAFTFSGKKRGEKGKGGLVFVRMYSYFKKDRLDLVDAYNTLLTCYGP
jgi:hypothetical protein